MDRITILTTHPDGAEFEPFGAHSHYGLILGEEGYTQVADAIRGFLEVHRL